MNSSEQPGAAPRVILQSVLGSTAHGTARPESDVDVRTVFLLPTDLLLSLGRTKGLDQELQGDENRWELGRFLDKGLGGCPTVFEMLSVEPQISTPEGDELRQLMPALLSRRVKNAFGSYANGQKKTMLSPRSGRTRKAAGDYLRVLYNGIELLRRGSMTVRITDTPVGRAILAARAGELSPQEVLPIGERLEKELEEALAQTRLAARPDVEAVNCFLLRVRFANVDLRPQWGLVRVD